MIIARLLVASVVCRLVCRVYIPSKDKLGEDFLPKRVLNNETLLEVKTLLLE